MNTKIRDKHYVFMTCFHSIFGMDIGGEILQNILKNPDINVNVQEGHGQTPLHYICKNSRGYGMLKTFWNIQH